MVPGKSQGIELAFEVMFNNSREDNMPQVLTSNIFAQLGHAMPLISHKVGRLSVSHSSTKKI